MKSNECGVCEREPQVTRAAAEVNGLACDVATQIERLVGRISPILSPTVPTPVAANGIAEREPDEVMPPLAEDLRNTGDILRYALRELERTIVRVEV